MNKLLMAVLTSAAMFATPAQAQDDDRNLQVKLLGTYVAPDGKITEFRTDVVGLPATTQTKANDNIVPTLAVEYFVKPKFSVETICCLTQHDVDGVTGVPGAELVSKAKLIPATLTAKYHFGAANVRPYLGLGMTYFWWIDVDPGADTIPLGVTRTTLSDEFGFVLQAGTDIAIGDSGFGLTIDAKRYFVDTTARWYSGDALAIETRHQLDPWVLSAGASYRF
ncbi:MAG: OmpW family outer membrane protein [Pseudomonadota bacterium]|jgi:outer membrane protein|uniref:OmpW/AlkL family protein n=1 Tax=Qipengyuania TaxID=1855416 RepID=UPI001A54A3AC|nr:OmpW family protein [Erythrobacter sp.]MCH2498552.1 outer membrane beta-barrel protein [Erythrobacter sp.]MEE2795433.1 OmpW family outer membrane protein [Pseudomonadota bacterium]|tara:strand:- start:1302 stop:1970 length:669 start_codon:yes stop_codon:yes gene_type:complete